MKGSNYLHLTASAYVGLCLCLCQSVNQPLRGVENVLFQYDGTENSEAEIIKVLIELMNNPLGVSPSKGKQGTTRGKEKILLTSVGIELTTSGLDLPLL